MSSPSGHYFWVYEEADPANDDEHEGREIDMEREGHEINAEMSYRTLYLYQKLNLFSLKMNLKATCSISTYKQFLLDPVRRTYLKAEILV